MTTRLKKAFLAGFAAATLTAFTAVAMADAAGPVAVIVSADNGSADISDAFLKKIYNNDILKWPDGVPIVLYDLSVESPERELFSARILGKRPEKVAELWAHRKITNQALNPPQTVKSQRLVLRRVATTRGAIGYVSLAIARDNPDVRIISTLK